STDSPSVKACRREIQASLFLNCLAPNTTPASRRCSFGCQTDWLARSARPIGHEAFSVTGAGGTSGWSHRIPLDRRERREVARSRTDRVHVPVRGRIQSGIEDVHKEAHVV